MSGAPENRHPARKPPRPPLPGRRSASDLPRPPNFVEEARQRAARPPRKPTPSGATRRMSQTDAQRPSTVPAPPTVPAPAAPRRKPTTIAELIPHIVLVAIKREVGLSVHDFDEKLMPRMRTMVPPEDRNREIEILQGALVDLAHALYIAIVAGQFVPRPLMCGVRACELASDLVERVLDQVRDVPAQRLRAIRCANLLVGLTLQSVRMLENDDLAGLTLRGFTDSYERAVITTFGLKTQAESAGSAPWIGQKNNPLDRRIAAAINTMSSVFGEYIGAHGQTLDEAVYNEVLSEFDDFMARFAPYIEGDPDAARQRRRMLRGDSAPGTPRVRVEPLEVAEVRPRPAGVEIRLSDGRAVFLSTQDARRIGAAADADPQLSGRFSRKISPA